MSARPPEPREPDEELMRRYQAGERAAFEALFVRHAAAVQAFLFHTTFRAELSQELGQKTWRAVHQHRAEFSPEQPFRPWLLGLAARVRRDATARDQGDREPPPPPKLPASSAPVLRALAALPDSYREVVVLHRIGRLSCTEIAKVLGATEAAVKARARQGYSQLAEALNLQV
jgi:RNA polymerase sigma-70 factor (ECF subfamily)